MMNKLFIHTMNYNFKKSEYLMHTWKTLNNYIDINYYVFVCKSVCVYVWKLCSYLNKVLEYVR